MKALLGYAEGRGTPTGLGLSTEEKDRGCARTSKTSFNGVVY